MTEYNGLRYYELEFNADASLVGGDGDVHAALAAGGITDLFIMSHGWNNSVGSARDLYQGMFSLLGGQLGAKAASSAAVGIIWPSLLFPEDDPTSPPPAAAAAVEPAAGAGAGPAVPTPSTGAELAAALAPAFPDQHAALATMGALLDTRPQDAASLTTFQSLANGLVTTAPLADEDAGESALLAANASTALGFAAAMAPAPAHAAEGLGNPFATLWSGAREVLRTLSYYEMKNRAGVIGANGLGPELGRLVDAAGGTLNIHLMGHSFGARLVSYSLSGVPDSWTGTNSHVKSLMLVQGAFSHFAFAHPLPFDQSRSGGLTDYVNRVDGPLMATFSKSDRANGWWYPTASMLKKQDAQSAADLTYRWGAVGHDGYQPYNGQPAKLAAVGNDYGFQAGVFYPLDANAIICANQSAFSGSHSDIQHPEVLWAVASASGLLQS